MYLMMLYATNKENRTCLRVWFFLHCTMSATLVVLFVIWIVLATSKGHFDGDLIGAFMVAITCITAFNSYYGYVVELRKKEENLTPA